MDREEAMKRDGFCIYCRYESVPAMYEPCRNCWWNYTSKFEEKPEIKEKRNEVLRRNEEIRRKNQEKD